MSNISAMAQADEQSVIQACLDEWEKQLAPHENFDTHLDNIDIYVCPRADLIEAIRNAPTVTLRQALFQVFSFRQTLAMMAGRSFL